MSNRDYNSTNITKYSSQMQAAADKYGIDPNLLPFVLAQENQAGDPNLPPNSSGATGLMQFIPTTFAHYEGPKANIYDPNLQIDAAAHYLRDLISQNDGNVYKALAIYDGAGTEVKNGTALPKETQGYLQNYSEYSNTPAQLIPGTPSNPTITPLQPDDASATPAVALFGVPYDLTAASAKQLQQAIDPPLIISSGIDETPWYKDPNIVRNKRPAPVYYPVTFKVYFDKKGPLSDSNNKPIVLCLNASLGTCSKSMQHIVSRQHTRTGVLVDLWGSNLDVISGEGSTGLFLNQVGMTSYISLAKPTDQVKAAIMQAFASSFTQKNSTMKPAKATTILGPLPPAPPYSPTNNFFTDSSLRVGARDAFVELLSLFKNNGTVWFRASNDTGYTSSVQQVAYNAWSPVYGRSTFQAANSRNDVMTRGRVEMSFRNSLYSGYFKSLSWTMDASKPYTWDFNFVFQVESSITAVDVAPTSQQYKKQQSTKAVAAAKQAADQAVAQSAATPTDPLAGLASNLPAAPPYIAPPNGVAPYVPPAPLYNPLSGV